MYANETQWRDSITRNFQHGYGERIPVMMLGLKRDLRVDGEGVIYPEEVRATLSHTSARVQTI